jgi:Fe-S cluster biogenesis protein NfuA
VPSKRRKGSEEKIFDRVRDVLEKDINPFIAAHGGRVDVAGVKGSTVYVTMNGGCQGCAAASSTMKGGVESAILSQVPEVSEVLDSTDHAHGSHPYYSPGESGSSPVG